MSTTQFLAIIAVLTVVFVRQSFVAWKAHQDELERRDGLEARLREDADQRVAQAEREGMLVADHLRDRIILLERRLMTPEDHAREEAETEALFAGFREMTEMAQRNAGRNA